MNQKPGSAVSLADPQLADQLDLRVDVRRARDETLEIRYDVTNRSGEPIVLLNLVQRPVAESEPDTKRVFVEPLDDDGVRISQRAWVDDPPSSIPPLHRMVVVDPEATVSDELSLALPLQDGNPRPAAASSLPNPPSRVQFCLGVVAASRLDAAVVEQARRDAAQLHPIGPSVPEQQTMVCSDVQPLG